MTHWRKDHRPELDDTTYEDWFTIMVAYFIRRRGMLVDAARREAKEFMIRQYRKRSEAMQCESQKDYYEARDNDWAAR